MGPSYLVICQVAGERHSPANASASGLTHVVLLLPGDLLRCNAKFAMPPHTSDHYLLESNGRAADGIRAVHGTATRQGRLGRQAGTAGSALENIKITQREIVAAGMEDIAPSPLSCSRIVENKAGGIFETTARDRGVVRASALRRAIRHGE